VRSLLANRRRSKPDKKDLDISDLKIGFVFQMCTRLAQAIRLAILRSPESSAEHLRRADFPPWLDAQDVMKR
jgi:hypothetical protein